MSGKRNKKRGNRKEPLKWKKYTDFYGTKQGSEKCKKDTEKDAGKKAGS